MRTFNFEGASYFFSTDFDKKIFDDEQMSINWGYIGRIRRSFRVIRDLSLIPDPSKKSATLVAHGGDDGKKWHYYDGANWQLMQDWIDQFDGRYSPLMVYSCNPMNREIEAHESVVIHPKKEFNLITAAYLSNVMRVFVPNEGYVA